MEFLLVILILVIVAMLSRTIVLRHVSHLQELLPFYLPSFRRTPFQGRKQKARALMRELRMRGEADDEIQHKLIQMLDGDREAAERLVARQRFGKGGEYSENYYWSQAIRALEESRHTQDNYG